MTSILTNISANTALLNLQNTVKNLADTQSQISTGLRISSAADNAAYFSIATVLRSDSDALSTVSDSLNLGGASLDVATNALDKVQTALSNIKTQLLSAKTPSVDRGTIQGAIKQYQNQLKSISDSANFNGQNYLSVDSQAANTNYNTNPSFVSSYSRDSAGTVTIGTISVDVTKTALFDKNAAATTGILDKVNAGTTYSVYNLDISGLTDASGDMTKLDAIIKQVDTAIGSVTDAQSQIGTARMRITQQSSFISSLKTSIDDGVGSMVDADLNTVSTRLQALQVQQQLGVQSLSIANQSTQMVLKLFQ